MSSDTLYRTMATLLAVVVVPYLALVTAAWMFQRHLIYLPSHDVPAPAVVGLAQAETVSFRSSMASRWQAGWCRRSIPSSAIRRRLSSTATAAIAPIARRSRRHWLGTASRLCSSIIAATAAIRAHPPKRARARRARGARLRAQPQRPRPGSHRLLRRIARRFGGASAGRGPGAARADPAIAFRVARRRRRASLSVSARSMAPQRTTRHAGQHAAHHMSDARVTSDDDSIVPVNQTQQVYEAAAGPKRLLTILARTITTWRCWQGKKLVEAILEFLKSF